MSRERPIVAELRLLAFAAALLSPCVLFVILTFGGAS